MSETRSVRAKGRTIEYEVQRSHRRTKTIALSVEGGKVLVKSPVGTSVKVLDDFVRSRADWIAERRPEDQRMAIPERFTNGETLPFLGKRLPLTVRATDPLEVSVELRRGRFRILVPSGLREPARSEVIRLFVQQWYVLQAEERLPDPISKWVRRFGYDIVPALDIGNQRRSWAVCRGDGTLRFSWRVMMLAEPLIEYIIAHELAHLTHFNHSRDFWRLVSIVMPDQEERRRQLREAERELQF